MFNQFIVIIFYAAVGAALLFGFINLVRSNLYDLRDAKRINEIRRHPHARRWRKRPNISVIVFSQNSGRTMDNCLRSVIAAYRKIELIIVDNASQDDTVDTARKFMKAKPRIKSRLVAKRKSSGRAAAILQATAYAQGEIIVVIDAETVLEQQALKNVVLHMAGGGFKSVLLNNRSSHNYSLTGLAAMFVSVMTLRIKKAGGFILPGLDTYNSAAAYSREFIDSLAVKDGFALNDINALRRLLKTELGFASDSVANTGGRPQPLSQLNFASRSLAANSVNLLRSLLAFIEPLVAGFMIYVALAFQNPGYALLAWLSFTALLILAIWSDENRKPTAKLGLSLLAVIAYLPVMIKSLVDSATLLANSLRPAAIDPGSRVK